MQNLRPSQDELKLWSRVLRHVVQEPTFPLAQALTTWNSASQELRLMAVRSRLLLHNITACKLQRKLATNKFIHPFLANMCGHRRRQVLNVLFEISKQLFHSALASCCWIESSCGHMLNGELHVQSPWCREDEFLHRCVELGIIVTFHKICSCEYHHCGASA